MKSSRHTRKMQQHTREKLKFKAQGKVDSAFHKLNSIRVYRDFLVSLRNVILYRTAS